LQLRLDIPPALAGKRLIGDSLRLEQILINLLANAIKFTEKGSVRLMVQRHEPNAWEIVVTDTGIGIPAHAQETIFDEFRQVDGTSRRQHGGTGLGLAIVRKLVLMMGGNIRLKSALGAGSTFTVVLPLKKENAEDKQEILV
jgi:signal transduction histidine kinase